jgi:hypothetical protein
MIFKYKNCLKKKSQASAIKDTSLVEEPVPVFSGDELSELYTLRNRGGMPNSEPNPEECDATEADSSTSPGQQIFSSTPHSSGKFAHDSPVLRNCGQQL